MKLLTIAVPCYNSQDYMRRAVESLLPGGERVEILIVDDGSSDDTGRIADEYAQKYPDTVRVIHQENAGHGGAVMTGIQNARGLYFKVIDSDDWADGDAYPLLLDTLGRFTEQPLDMVICNYIYDKAGAWHKHTSHYRGKLPEGRVFGWEETGRFHKGQYLLMHAITYRTELLRECGMDLPRHTFYVDDLYAYVPLPQTKRLYYLDADLYHYYIGREGQSVQEEVMIRRIDQQLHVNRLMLETVDPFNVEPERKKRYMLGFLGIVSTISLVLLTKMGTAESERKKAELWDFMRRTNPAFFRAFRRSLLGVILRLPGKAGRLFILFWYRIARLVVGFN